MAKPTSSSIPSPKGTRDLYPEDLLRQRFITEAWRRVSIRHGFEEIAGPTFEMLDLYKKKSGEGIVSELFSFRRSGGEDDYALRPEFTPTLARMYAAKAASLPSPCKWFTAGPYFRAEKPQRGRLREFLQWNCDVMGGSSSVDKASYDADVISAAVGSLQEFGMGPDSTRVNMSDRVVLRKIADFAGIDDSRFNSIVSLWDQWDKLSPVEREEFRKHKQIEMREWERVVDARTRLESDPDPTTTLGLSVDKFETLGEAKDLCDIRLGPEWTRLHGMIARGLAYYTGTVFELIADGERAVAGGGRYDNLIELFGGPPTPAVGFGMGDVVLGLLLEDKGLMPEGPALMDALSQKPASLRPEAFVIASEQGEAQVEPLLASLRRGFESPAWKERGGKPWDTDRYCSKSGGVQPMHARRSYKSTKNIGKLLGEARKQNAKFAVIIESGESAKVENLETREDLGTFALHEVAAKLAERL